MTMTFDFSGKSVFVVGGTSGINLGIAKGFAEWGADVFVASRKQDKVDSTVEALSALGAKAGGTTFDVRELEAVTTGFDAAKEFFGRDIDILVSGAAGNIPSRFMDLSANAIKAMVEIDLMGTYNVMRACYPHMTRPDGRIINIGAPQAFMPMTHQSAVCAAKAGVDMVTKTLAIEWGEEGLTVNTVSPGPIEHTEGFERLIPTPEVKEHVRKSVPLQRLGQAEDVAKVCGFLASDAGAYVSGVVLPADGGWSLSGASSIGSAAGRMMDKLTSKKS